jgi:uncharacterized DUF497 family protein
LPAKWHAQQHTTEAGNRGNSSTFSRTSPRKNSTESIFLFACRHIRPKTRASFHIYPGFGSLQRQLDFIQFVYTIRLVLVTFDPAKDAENRRNHGISLQRAEDFDVDTAFFELEDSQDYGEERWMAIGWLDAKLHTLIFKFEPAVLRAISLRKSTKEERKLYAENQ